MSDTTLPPATPWLLIIHQIPPKPDYLRVKIGRRLQRVGAVAVKSSVYALPYGDQPLEDFQWIRQEIVEGGGDATICRASFVGGLTDEQLRDAFREARDVDYSEIAAAAREIANSADAAPAEREGRRSDDLARLRKRFAAVSAIDFFAAAGRADAHAAIEQAEAAVSSPASLRAGAAAPRGARDDRATYRGRTWVTRTGIFVDRMASAWLIRRFIDPDARFRYVDPETYRATPGELRFDMFEGEFTHSGDRCTFETLLERFALGDRALRVMAEVVHDIDLRDDKFSRQETAGIERTLTGIAQTAVDDDDRAQRSAMLFDALYSAYGSEPVAGA